MYTNPPTLLINTNRKRSKTMIDCYSSHEWILFILFYPILQFYQWTETCCFRSWNEKESVNIQGWPKLFSL